MTSDNTLPALLIVLILAPPIGLAQTQRQLMLLSPPVTNTSGTGVASTVGLENPAWTTSQFYYGSTGSKKHASWVHANNCDSTGVQYNFQNTGGDISSSLTPPSGGPAPLCLSSSSDGSGIWTYKSIHSFTLTNPGKVVVSGCPGSCQFVIGSLTQTINGTGGLSNGQSVLFYGFTSVLCLNGNWGPASSVMPHSFIIAGGTLNFVNSAPSSCTNNAPGGTLDTGTVLVTNNSQAQASDDFGLYLLPGSTGPKIEIAWSSCDNGTSLPNYMPTCNDTNFNNWVNDAAWTSANRWAFDLAFANTAGTTMSGATYNTGTPQYVATQTWANKACKASPWQPNTNYVFHNCVWDGSNYQLFVGTPGSGANPNVTEISASTPPSPWNPSVGGHTTDGACMYCWLNEGSTNAPPQEFTANTTGAYQGNSCLSGLGAGVYTVSSMGSCMIGDLVTGYPVITDTPFQYAFKLFLQNYLGNRAGSYGFSPNPPLGDFAYFTVGTQLNGQGYPVNASVLQANANYLNNNVTTSTPPNQWTQLWAGTYGVLGSGAHGQLYNIVQSLVQQNPVLKTMVQVSPQGSPITNDLYDPTLLADIESWQAAQFGLGLAFEGGNQADSTAWPNSPTGADWVRNAATYYYVPNMSFQMGGPGNCSGTQYLYQNLLNAVSFPGTSYEVYPSDYWSADPNHINYTQTCGQLNAATMFVWQSAAGRGAVRQPPAVQGLTTDIALAQNQTLPALTVHSFFAGGGPGAEVFGVNVAGFETDPGKIRIATSQTITSTTLAAIPGLSFSIPSIPSTTHYLWSCDFSYSQATGTAADQIGIQASAAPSNIYAVATVYTSTSASTSQTLPTLNTNVATPITATAFTPSAFGTGVAQTFSIHLAGNIDNPASTANTISIMALTGNGTYALTFYRGGGCQASQTN